MTVMSISVSIVRVCKLKKVLFISNLKRKRLEWRWPKCISAAIDIDRTIVLKPAETTLPNPQKTLFWKSPAGLALIEVGTILNSWSAGSSFSHLVSDVLA